MYTSQCSEMATTLGRNTAYSISAYSAYYPASVPFADALRQMVCKANAVLPPACRIRKLSFDKDGWDAALLQWLETEQDIWPLTWVKATAPNRRLLSAVPPSEFVPLEGEAP